MNHTLTAIVFTCTSYTDYAEVDYIYADGNVLNNADSNAIGFNNFLLVVPSRAFIKLSLLDSNQLKAIIMIKAKIIKSFLIKPLTFSTPNKT